MQPATSSSLQSIVDNDKSIQNAVRRLLRRSERVLAFEEAMFQWRSRHLILVLTLNYKEAWRALVSVEDIARDRDRLFNNLRSNPVLRGIAGYLWLIEEGGGSGGVHMHLVIFYDGQCNHDVHYAEEIGEYWSEVATQGRGDFHNSNKDKLRLAQSKWGDATGQINRNDFGKRESLRKYLIKYLCKDEQHVSRTNQHIRTFGTSLLPV